MIDTLENKILLSLGRLEGKVDSILTTQASYEDKLVHMETRIGHLEKVQSYWAGAAALLGAFIGILTTLMNRY